MLEIALHNYIILVMKNKERITFVLSSDLLDRVDVLAKSRNESRSATLEKIVSAGIDYLESVQENADNQLKDLILTSLFSSKDTMNYISQNIYNYIIEMKNSYEKQIQPVYHTFIHDEIKDVECNTFIKLFHIVNALEDNKNDKDGNK